jgi:hypothetical protein
MEAISDGSGDRDGCASVIVLALSFYGRAFLKHFTSSRDKVEILGYQDISLVLTGIHRRERSQLQQVALFWTKRSPKSRPAR